MSSVYYRLKNHRQFKRKSIIELADEQNVLDNLGSSIDLLMKIVYKMSSNYPQSIDVMNILILVNIIIMIVHIILNNILITLD